jgi:hypothetical protein
MQFKLQMHSVLLIYLKCNLSIFSTTAQLNKKFKNLKNFEVITCNLSINEYESEKEVGKNIHVYIEFNRTIRARNTSFFDLTGNLLQSSLEKDGKNKFLSQKFHPIIQKVKKTDRLNFKKFN